MIPIKRHRVSNLKLAEISSVDNPAQIGARAVLIKSAGDALMTDIEIRKNASAVASGAQPAYSANTFEDAMLRRAEELSVRQNVTPEQPWRRTCPATRPSWTWPTPPRSPAARPTGSRSASVRASGPDEEGRAHR